MLAESVVNLASGQWLLTAGLYIVVAPLSLGIALLIALLEMRYLFTGQLALKQRCQDWGRWLAVTVAISLMSRLWLLAQMGLTQSYALHYSGDAVALPVALDGLGSILIAALLYGPFARGWQRLAAYQHCCITLLLLVSLNLSAGWSLMIVDYLFHPNSAAFNPASYRMELLDGAAWLQRAWHTSQLWQGLLMAYGVASAVLLAISARAFQRNVVACRSSFSVAACVSAVSLTVLLALKLTEPTVITADNAQARLDSGVIAYQALQALRDQSHTAATRETFIVHQADLGYALLLPKQSNDDVAPTPAQQAAALAQLQRPSTVMVLLDTWIWTAFSLSALFAGIAAAVSLRKQALPGFLQRLCLWNALLPISAGLAVAALAWLQLGPWAVNGVLPRALAVSSLSSLDMGVGLVLQLAVFAGVLWLIVKHLSPRGQQDGAL
jgi:cytochrome d ubiquinol oxidase subunit I